MTIQKFIERKRDMSGRYVKTTENGWKAKSSEYQRAYVSSHPWVKNWQYSKSRAHTRGMEHSLTADDFRVLWYRDSASEMDRPSIDRIDATKGYVDGNCRFLELKKNISLGNKGIKRFRECPNCGWNPSNV